MQKSFFASLRTAFISGLITLAPLAITLFVLNWLVVTVGGTFSGYFFFFVPDRLRSHPLLGVVWDLLATLIVIILVTILGYLSRYFFGKFFGGMTERFIQSIPGVGNIYHSVKQIVGTFSSQKRNLFTKVVLVQFPSKGSWSLGFLTSHAKAEVEAKSRDDLWSVFIPTTPNPTGGFLIFLPKDEIIELEMSVGDGMKMIISGGTVVPPWPLLSDPAPKPK